MEENSEEILLTAKDIVEAEPVEPGKRRLRVASGFLDVVLIVLLAFGLSYLLSFSPLGRRLSDDRYKMQGIEDSYKLMKMSSDDESTYGYKYYSYEEHYESEKEGHRVYNDEQGEYIVLNRKTISENVLNAYKSKISKNEEYISVRNEAKLINYGILASSALVGETVFLFVVPSLNKKRASLGKMAFGLMVVSFDDFDKPQWWRVLIRFGVVFALTALLMIPLLQWTAILLPLLILVTLFVGARHRTLHDLISGTYVIDGRSFDKEAIDIYFQTRR